jgi:phthiocerol/phenolphthiocerol synthesis type-I polyketide synthase E
MTSPTENTGPGTRRDDAISPAEGARILLSILAAGAGPQVVVSPAGLPRQEGLAGRVAAGAGGDDARVSRLGLAARYVETPYTAPRDDVERTMAALWRQAVGMEQVGLDDDWQELGMNSITVVRLAARISEIYGVAVSVGEIIDWRTLRAAAEGVQVALKRRYR